MMRTMPIVCLLKTLNRYIRLVESLCSVNYVFQILEENLHDMGHSRGYRLFPGWLQVMSVVSWHVSNSSWMVSGSFRSFQFVPRFSKYIEVLIKKCSIAGAYPENSVGRRGLRK